MTGLTEGEARRPVTTNLTRPDRAEGDGGMSRALVQAPVTDAAKVLLEALDPVPTQWWRYVACRTCNAPIQHLCYTSESCKTRTPHVARRRTAAVLHGTLWLLSEFPGDVLEPKVVPS